MSSIWNCLSKESAIKLVHAFFSSRLNYCSALLVDITETSLIKLQRIQNMATRIVTQTIKRDDITPPPHTHTHTVFMVLLLTFKALNNLAPDYLTLLLGNYKPQRQLRLISADCSSYQIKMALDGAFSRFAPRMWNDLPLHIRSTDKLNKAYGWP